MVPLGFDGGLQQQQQQRKRSGNSSDLEGLKPTKSVKLERSNSFGSSDKSLSSLNTSSISNGNLNNPASTSNGNASNSTGLTIRGLKKTSSGMPTPTINSAGIMVPPPAGPEMTARGKPTFCDLVTAGAFPPGTYEFSVGTVQSVTASVNAGGVITYGSEQYASISSFALAAARSRNPARQACDGWKEVRLAGRKLELWRQAYLAKQPPPEIPAGCLKG
ncbi:hypothetical protein OEZ85_009366 [Tetradesmus obliquus]|uniref:RAMA domain-containing protein n=1 Tax=Tetradesmus obliquus TaxID=3088 RepID=A0ABY8UCP5_TETOB|nr:hypothetical protein OEZ85_009366 [Tetradesmus obliquus]